MARTAESVWNIGKVLHDHFAKVMDLQAEAADFVRRDGAGAEPEHSFRDLPPLSLRGLSRHIAAANIPE